MGSGSGELDDTAVATPTPAPALDETARSGDGGGAPAGLAVELREVSPSRYRVAGEIGRGGLGRILRARDVHLDRTVALKELLGDDGRARRRFVREALITARLQHPSIVPVYEAGRWPDHAPFYAMKLVAGKPLSEVLAAAGSLDARLAHVATVLAVADAIAYAHSERIVHRDLKPHNVLVGAFGETVVIDWGLAKDLSVDDDDALDAGPYRRAASDQTIDGAVLGTPAYMPPEQAAGGDVDQRADVYALGAMLYHVVSGRAPHTGDTVERMIEHVVAGTFPPLADVEPRVPPDLAALVGKAMAREPGDRYPSARELADDLRRFTTGQLVGAHRYTLAQRAGRFLRRHRALVTLGAVAVAVLAGFAVWSFRRIGAERDTAVARARDAIDSGNRATLAQAKAALDRDPAEALAWLARLDPDGPGWDTARVLAADALARPRLVHLVRGLPGGLVRVAVDPDRPRVIGTGQGVVGVADFTTDTARAYPIPEPRPGDEDVPAFEPCRDGRRALRAGDTPIVLALDTGAVTPAAPPDRKGWIAAQGCVDTWRFEHDTFADDTLTWWDARAGAPRTLADHGVNQAWATPDGRHAISVDDGGAITWWDPEHGAHHAIGRAPANAPLVWPATSGDGRIVVLPWEHPLVLIGGAPVADPPEHVDTAAVTAAGSLIAYTSGRDDVLGGAVELLDGTGGHDGSLAAPGAVASLEFTRDGTWLSADGEHAVAWELATRQRVALPLPGDAHYMLAGRQLVVMARDGTATVWEPRPAHVLRAFDAGQAALSRDGRWLVVEDEARLTRVDLRGQLADESIDVQLTGMTILADDQIAADGAVVMPSERALWLWRPGAAPVRLEDSRGFPSVRMSHGGLGLIEGAVVEIGATGARRVWALPKDRDLDGESADLDVFAVSDPAHPDAGVRVLDRTTGVETPVPGSAPPAVFSRDGRWLAAAAANGAGIVLWDVAARRAQPIGAPRGKVARLIVSNDGRRVAIVGAASITLVDRDGGAPRALDPGDGTFTDASFDGDGRRLVAATDHEARLWEVDSGAMRVIAEAPVQALRVDGDAITMVLPRAVIEVRDDLPRDPAALSALLRAQPYDLEEAPGGAARVRMRR